MKKIFPLILIFLLAFNARTSAQVLSGEEIQNLVVGEVEDALSARGETRRHEISFLRSFSPISLPEGIVDVKVFLPTSLNYVGTTPVRLNFFVDGRYFREMSIATVVKIFDKAIVCNHDLRIEVPVNDGDFHVEEIPIDGRNEFVKDAKEIRGLVPHRYIRAGSPVTKAYFQTAVVVQSGQPVLIVAKHNGITVSAKGISLMRGRVGALVKVRNETSNKILSAKVIDAQTVEVVSNYA